MGCGQSKINLYPRRNKHGGNKANGAKKTGAGEKEEDEEEGAAGAAVEGGEDDVSEDADKGKHLLPLVSHAALIEVSASQQDFFKMLDDKIDKGRDYDSSSESEIRAERDRRSRLVREWQSASQASSQSQPSPPTPARRRPAPPRRAHSAHAAGDPASPARRPHTTAAATRRGQPSAGLPFCQKVIKNGGIDASESPAEAATGGREPSQITYNPTFQTHSPAHAPLKTTAAPSQQPYIAQIVTYPTVSQTSPNSYGPPPETSRVAADAGDPAKYPSSPRQAAPATAALGSAGVPLPPQSNIYYIHGAGGGSPQPSTDQMLTQKQQTALHLQHYVAMKQAQQNMFGYLQRVGGGAYPGAEFPPDPRAFDATDESYGVAYYAGYRGPPRPRSAPPHINPLVAMSPLVNPVSVFAHVAAAPPPPYGMFPTEVQYYQQAQLVHGMYRPGSAGSAGTLTRYHGRDRHGTPVAAAAVGDAGSVKSNECQSMNILRQKAVGQIVSLGGQDLGVYQNAKESTEAASPGEAPFPQPPAFNHNQRISTEIGNQKCSSETVKMDRVKNSNGGTVKTRTQKIKNNSRSVDSKIE